MMSFSESLALKLVSLLLALILWITILGFKREEIKKNVKLEPLLPPGMVLVNKPPSNIQFSLAGPRVLLKDVEKKIPPIRPDLRRSRDTTISISISEELLGELPAGIRVTGFYPPNVILRLEEVVERYVTVKPTVNGSPAEGYEIATIKSNPLKVAVSGPKSLVQGLEFVGTDIVDAHDLKDSKEMDVNVEVDTTQGFQLSRTTMVHVKVTTKKVHRGSER
jgi:hypothetical protein